MKTMPSVCLILCLFSPWAAYGSPIDCLLLARDRESSIQRQLVGETIRALNARPDFTGREVSADGTAIPDAVVMGAFDAGNIEQRRVLARHVQGDLLLLLDTRTLEGNHAVDLVAVEPTMGLRLARATFPWDPDRPDTSVAPIVNAIVAASKPLVGGVRKVYAVPAFQSMDLTPKYSSMMDAYKAWVEHLLLNQPGAVVLEMQEAETLMLMPRDKETVPEPYIIAGTFQNEGIGSDRRISLGLEMSRGGKVLGTETRQGVRVRDAGEAIGAMLFSILDASPEHEAASPAAFDQGPRLMELADALGRIGFWDNAIPLYHALLLQNAYSEEATLGLLEAYGVLLTRSAKARHQNPFQTVELGEKMVDLVSTLPPDWRVSNRKRLQEALHDFQYYHHPHRNAFNREVIDANIRLKASDWAMAEMGITALGSPSRAVQWGDFPREIGNMIRNGLSASRKERPDAFFMAWETALHALDGYKDSFNIRFGQMIYEKDLNWIHQLSLSENPEIALVARICIYLSTIDPAITLDTHRETIASFDGFERLNKKDANWVYNYLPKALEYAKARTSRPDTVSAATGVTLSNLTAGIIQSAGRTLSREVNDWIYQGGREFLATDAGAFEVLGRGRFQEWQTGNVHRLSWDGRFLWCFSESGISILSGPGERTATYPSDTLPFPAAVDSMFFVPLETGWGCLIGGQTVDDIRRSWIAALDIRDTDRGTAPRFTLLQKGVDQKRDVRNIQVAFTPFFAFKIGTPGEHKVLTFGYPMAHKMVVDMDRHAVSYLQSSRFVAEFMVEHGGSLWAVTSNFSKGLQRWGVLEWKDTGKEATVWHAQPSYTYNVPASGSGIFQAMFIEQNRIHLVSKPWHHPAWFSVDLDSKRVTVVADQLPPELDDFKLQPRFVRSSAYGLVLIARKNAFAVSAPLPETLPTLSNP